MTKKREIRNSTAEFLFFQAEGKEQGVEVYYKDENIWATQKAIATLFDCDRSVVTKHLGNIFESVELKEEAVCAKFAHTAEDGKTYNTKFYSLDAIIAVGYRVNSIRATQFRQWATSVLRLHAETEFEKYRIVQDRLFQSDFDRFLGALPFEDNNTDDK